MKHIDAVRGVHFQPVSYFGRTPDVPGDEDRITLPELMDEIEKTDRRKDQSGKSSARQMREFTVFIPRQLRQSWKRQTDESDRQIRSPRRHKPGLQLQYGKGRGRSGKGESLCFPKLVFEKARRTKEKERMTAMTRSRRSFGFDEFLHRIRTNLSEICYGISGCLECRS